MNRTKSPSLADQHCARAQRGSALLDVALAVAIAGAMVVGGMQYWSQQLRSDTARALAGQYKLINAAVASYMTVNWTLLTGSLPPNCDAGSVFTVQEGAAATSNNCSLNVAGNDGTSLQIRHALQPTIQELQDLNFLIRTVNGRPLLPDDPNVVTWSRHSGVWAPTTHTLAIHIRRVCTNQSDPNPATCIQANRDLQSVVFNQRPYSTGINGDWAILNEAMLAMENEGLVSMPNVGGARRNIVGPRGDTVLPNPISGDRINPPPLGVLAMRNGFGSAGWGQFTRRDGTAPPTANWDFANQELGNVGRLQAANVVATDALALPTRRPGTTCDAATESISLSTDNQSLQACRGGVWKGPSLGTRIDPTSYIDVDMGAISGEVIEWRLTNLPSRDWGMPSLIGLWREGEAGQQVKGQPALTSVYECQHPGLRTLVWCVRFERVVVPSITYATWRFYRILRD